MIMKYRNGLQLNLVMLLRCHEAMTDIIKNVSMIAKLMQTFNKGALEFSFAYSGSHLAGGLIVHLGS